MLRDVNRENNNDLRTVTKISIPLKSSKLAEMRTNGVSQMENVFIEPTPLKNGLTGNGKIGNKSKLIMKIINISGEKLVLKKIRSFVLSRDGRK